MEDCVVIWKELIGKMRGGDGKAERAHEFYNMRRGETWKVVFLSCGMVRERLTVWGKGV